VGKNGQDGDERGEISLIKMEEFSIRRGSYKRGEESIGSKRGQKRSSYALRRTKVTLNRGERRNAKIEAVWGGGRRKKVEKSAATKCRRGESLCI